MYLSTINGEQNPYPTSKKRDKNIDIAKGIGIILVVYAHAPCCLIGREISLFHMPLFFLLSGQVSNFNIPLITFIRKKLKSLIYPFIFFWILSFIYGYLLSKSPTLWEYIHSLDTILPLNVPIWFLLALFEICIISYLCHRFIRNSFARLATITSITFLGYYFSRNQIILPLYLSAACIGYAFYEIGWYIKAKEWSNKINNIFITILSVIGYSLGFLYAKQIDVRTSIIDSNYLLFIVAALSGSLLILNFSHYIQHRSNWLARIGQQSLMVLCIHMPLFSCIKLFLTPIKFYLYDTTGHKDIVIESIEGGLIYGIVLSIISIFASYYIGLGLRKLFPQVFG